MDQRAIEFWQVASTFPANKEEVYSEHAIAQEFDKWQGATVLEYGCGGGADTLSYLRRGCTVYACDIVETNIATTKRRAHEAGLADRLRPTLLTDSAQIPIADAAIDVASAHGVLHHIKQPLPILQEIRRTLRNGGILYVMLYTEQLYAQHKATVDRLMQERGISRGEAFGWATDGEGCPWAVAYTASDGQALLGAAGFDVVSTMDYHAALFRCFRARKA